MKTIDRFDGEYAWLSNFYDSPFEAMGFTWKTVEHFFQGMKTTDEDERRAIAEAPTPGKAKRLGRSCTLRAGWDDIKTAVMLEGLIFKFKDPQLRQKLIDTGDAMLIEGNTWHDTFWGVCDGVGENHLGQCLMYLRGMYQSQDA